jgi:3-hydroxyacyl-CoA dehydrogenase/enoyl-CoA hydratase/3-hydroxybutyryl-CoA epimerase
VEVVVSKQTSPETVERALAFTRQLAKLPVVVQDSPGFLVNRVLFPYLLDAAELFELGVDAQQMDDALVAWGMPMGPLRLIDEIGVDITVDIADTLAEAFGRRNHAAAVLLWLRDGKMLGRKTGSGFYKYEGKAQTLNESVADWRSKLHGDVEGPDLKPVVPKTADEITDRLIFLMVNEAARCLEEKVVATAEDADFGMMMGTGFAPFRGGPLRYADHYGLKKLVAELDALHSSAGEKFAPCDLLRQHAEKGTKFYEDTARSAA